MEPSTNTVGPGLMSLTKPSPVSETCKRAIVLAVTELKFVFSVKSGFGDEKTVASIKSAGVSNPMCVTVPPDVYAPPNVAVTLEPGAFSVN